jgi:signal transduction histidine kinase
MSGAADALPEGAEHAGEVGRWMADGMRALCHDLIGPAATIKILVQAAYAEADPDPAIRNRLQLIASEAGRIADICRQVLDRPHHAEPIRLDVFAAELADSARTQYKTAIETVTSPITLRVPPATLARILGNLLANACKAAGPMGLVRLHVAADGEQARLTVADSGAGFDVREIGRASLGLDIIGALALECGGSVQMGASDLGGLDVSVVFPCLPQTVPLPRELSTVLAAGPQPRRQDAEVPA